MFGPIFWKNGARWPPNIISFSNCLCHKQKVFTKKLAHFVRPKTVPSHLKLLSWWPIWPQLSWPLLFPRFCCAFASFLLSQSRLFCTSVSLSSLCLIPPHSVLSPFWYPLSVKPRKRAVAVIVVLASIFLHCSPRLLSQSRLACTSLCASLCVARVTSTYLCLSVTLSVSLLGRRFSQTSRYSLEMPKTTWPVEAEKFLVQEWHAGLTGGKGWHPSRKGWTSDRWRRAEKSSLLVIRSSIISTLWPKGRTTNSQRRNQ